MSEIKLLIKKEGPALPAGPWVEGVIDSPCGPVARISTTLAFKDNWGNFKCRVSSFRNNYAVSPGLYAVGRPDRGSDVLVTANYKYSFDVLRRELKGIDAWVLVLDTKGINVWCAAGKGTFGTGELIKRISSANLAAVAEHGRIVLPQLGAPGVSAHEVMRATGFRVHYGPVRARDIPDYLNAGLKATRQMRTVRFSIADRFVLSPMEIIPAMKKYYPLYAVFVLALFGLQPSGILFRSAFAGGFRFLLLGLIAVFSGAFLTPVLLPYVPFRSFAIKGWIMGAEALLLSFSFSLGPVPKFYGGDGVLLAASFVFFPMASSYIALQFTGSTTFTGMSGVKKELRIAIPVYLASLVMSLALLAAYKLIEWRLI